MIFKPNDKILKSKLRTLMWNNVGIVRTKKNLKFALDEVDLMISSDTGKLLKLRLLTSKAIIESAIKRDKSLGAHYIKN